MELPKFIYLYILTFTLAQNKHGYHHWFCWLCVQINQVILYLTNMFDFYKTSILCSSAHVTADSSFNPFTRCKEHNQNCSGSPLTRRVAWYFFVFCLLCCFLSFLPRHLCFLMLVGYYIHVCQGFQGQWFSTA